MKRDIKSLGEFIVEQQKDFPEAHGALAAILAGIKRATKILNRDINRAGLVSEILGEAGAENVQGEKQKKLDIIANEIMKQSLEYRGEIAGMVSEEEEGIISFDNNGKFVVLTDPLDGSSNIDVNVSVSTTFSIYKRISPVGTPLTMEDFLQAGNQQLVAGYVIYGSSTMLVYTVGKGVNGFTYDPSIGMFLLSHPNIKIQEEGNIYSINEGGYVKFPMGVKQYIKYCQENVPEEGRPYNLRYIGTLVADFHRNMLKGGIYMYPRGSHYPDGKLRLNYECNPIALIAEQAGGLATDGEQRILDIKPNSLHQRSPFFVGSKNMVNKAMNFISEFGD